MPMMKEKRGVGTVAAGTSGKRALFASSLEAEELACQLNKVDQLTRTKVTVTAEAEHCNAVRPIGQDGLNPWFTVGGCAL